MAELKELVAKLPAGLRSDWLDTNHFELTSNHPDHFWLMLSPLFADAADDDWCRTELGRRVGLLMDIAVAVQQHLTDNPDEFETPIDTRFGRGTDRWQCRTCSFDTSTAPDGPTCPKCDPPHVALFDWRPVPDSEMLFECSRCGLRRHFCDEPDADCRCLWEPRPLCRDCADSDGTCPHDGLPCELPPEPAPGSVQTKPKPKPKQIGVGPPPKSYIREVVDKAD